MEDAVEQLDHLARTVSECTICKELVACRLRAVPGTGHPHCEVMVVSLHPSVADEQGGRAAGESTVDELADFMPSLATSREKLYVTTVAKCVPRTDCALRETKTSECDACFRYLSRELSITTPHYILSVGEQASRYLLGKLFSTPPYRQGDALELRLFDNPAFKVVPVATPEELRSRAPKARKEYTERLHALGQAIGL